MFFKKPALIRKYVEDDVKLIKEVARAVIYLDENNKPRMLLKTGWKLNVIAVIGQASLSGEFFKEAVLLEVGIGATRPYHDSRFKKRIWIPQRKKWFFISDDQYKASRNLIFRIIKLFARSRINNWKSSSWNVEMPKFYYNRRQKEFSESGRWVECQKGARFSVSKADSRILADIYNFELENPLIKYQLDGFARFIDLCFCGRSQSKYRKNKDYTMKEMLKMANSSSGFAAVAKQLADKKLLPHQYWHILKSGLVTKNDLLMNIIVGFELSSEQEINDAGFIIGSVELMSNIFGFQLRTISKSSNRDSLIFEVSFSDSELNGGRHGN